MTSKVVNYILVISLVAFFASTTNAADFDVTKYGAKADKSTDMSTAFLAAWKEACNESTPSNVIIPKGSYKLSEVLLEGPCNAPIKITLSGTLLANPNPNSIKNNAWITIQKVNQLTVLGGGTIDGQGLAAWKSNQCSKNVNCDPHPLNLGLNYLNDSVIQDITSKDSKGFHLNVISCQNTTLLRLNVVAPETSLNTDGIHLGRCNVINIIDTVVKTGDDCISIGDGMKNLTIKGVQCGPGHGISVGSLGRFKNEEPVVGLSVTNCTITGTMFGVRIKSWPAREAGEVNGAHFENIIMNNVSNPILIDQVYCPWNQCNKQKPSQVKISKVSFKNIRGTSYTQNAINFACSSGIPCEGVEVADINLSYSGPLGSAISTCSNVKPSSSGKVVPALCAAPAPA